MSTNFVAQQYNSTKVDAPQMLPVRVANVQVGDWIVFGQSVHTVVEILESKSDSTKLTFTLSYVDFAGKATKVKVPYRKVDFVRVLVRDGISHYVYPTA